MWFVANWRWLAPVVGAIALFGSGWHFGSQYVHDKWDASLVKQKELMDKALESDRKAAQQRSEELEADLAKMRKSNSALTRRLNNEIPSNTVYSTCVVPPRGVSILNGFRSGAFTE